MNGVDLTALAVLVVLTVAGRLATRRWRAARSGQDAPAPPPPPPRPMTPGRFVGYVLLGCVTVFVLFPALAFLVLAALVGP